ncbi:NDR1/HIN1-like protein 26 [Elaeis guineensis]|uniref:NDR1/HIN1-like protein 26 n=1 Tax=Elaeis guineensis var. tenera TaxID=51953 RepID=A0A6J0PDF1_ELAGV|nr:NDR1/HIN1-like protein 26 [Elaeis guineensis]
MSLYLTSSPKDCSKKGFHINKLNKKLLYTLSTLILSILSATFLIWLILHPSKPEFSLRDTSLYELSLSSPHLLNSTIQTTIVSKNPNDRVGIYYDQLRVYAAYKGQQITADSLLPPFYQGHQDSNLLSASLHGTGMPVAPSFGYEVGRDQTAGRLYLGLKLDGQLRWKVGTWVSGRYRFDVDCMAVIAIRPGDTSGLLSSVQGNQCSTTV